MGYISGNRSQVQPNRRPKKRPVKSKKKLYGFLRELRGADLVHPSVRSRRRLRSRSRSRPRSV